MSVLVIWSSPNQDGLTAAAKEAVLAGLKAAGTEAEAVQLNKLKLGHCCACGSGRGWGSCRKEGTCWMDDDFQGLYEKMQAADGVVFVTAVYWHDVTECMKAFLDRLRRCDAGHNHLLTGKKTLLAACADGSGKGAVPCLDRLESVLADMEMQAADRLPVTRFNRSYLLPALEAAGGAFAAALSE